MWGARDKLSCLTGQMIGVGPTEQMPNRCFTLQFDIQFGERSVVVLVFEEVQNFDTGAKGGEG